MYDIKRYLQDIKSMLNHWFSSYDEDALGAEFDRLDVDYSLTIRGGSLFVSLFDRTTRDEFAFWWIDVVEGKDEASTLNNANRIGQSPDVVMLVQSDMNGIESVIFDWHHDHDQYSGIFRTGHRRAMHHDAAKGAVLDFMMNEIERVFAGN